MKRVIWHNDASAHFDYIMEENPDMSDEQVWQACYDQIDACYDAEQVNLAGCKTDGAIVALGKVQRWCGARSGFAELDGDSVADIVRFVARVAAEGDNTATLFVDDGGDIVLEMYGHDNPTSPTRMVFREVCRHVSEAGKDALLDAFYTGASTRWTLARMRTKSLGHLPAAVYGWDEHYKCKKAA